MKYNEKGQPLQKIVYIKVECNGKTELKAVELYADHTLKQ